MTDRTLEIEAPVEDLARLFVEIGVPFALIGGHAVNHWLTPRLTGDVDVTAQLDHDQLRLLRGRLEVRGFRVSREHGGEQPSGADFIRFVSSGGDVVFEIQVAKTEFQRELIRRAVLVGEHLRVATAADLIVLKLIADRPKDQADLAGLSCLAAVDWEHVERYAQEWGVGERLKRLRR